MRRFSELCQDAKNRIDRNINERNLYCNKNILISEGEEMLHMMGMGGKHLRGILVYIGYYMMGNNEIEEADALAAAFEIFQTAILVHDDVIDHAATRRGQETIHMQYFNRYTCYKKEGKRDFGKEIMEMGRSLAICLGDLGLYEAEQRLVDAYKEHPRFGELLTYYHKMIMNTIRGELLDVQLPCMERYELWDKDGIDMENLEEMILDIYHLKTSCYTVIGPLCCGMILGGAPLYLVNKMEEIADLLGIAFQLQDDILGIYGVQERTGKDVGSDISEYKQTLLYSYTKKHDAKLYQELREYYGKEEVTNIEVQRVGEIFQESGALDYVKGKIKDLFAEAVCKLNGIEEITEDRKAVLLEFISYIIDRKA